MIEPLYKTKWHKPFSAWLDSLPESDRERVLVEISALEAGDRSHVHPIKGGGGELKIDCGPGYRVFFGDVSDGVSVVMYFGVEEGEPFNIRQAFKRYSLRNIPLRLVYDRDAD